MGRRVKIRTVHRKRKSTPRKYKIRGGDYDPNYKACMSKLVPGSVLTQLAALHRQKTLTGNEDSIKAINRKEQLILAKYNLACKPYSAIKAIKRFFTPKTSLQTPQRPDYYSDEISEDEFESPKSTDIEYIGPQSNDTESATYSSEQTAGTRRRHKRTRRSTKKRKRSNRSKKRRSTHTKRRNKNKLYR